jgi:alpha-tubulin suppressor-like RCC1 family protein
VLLNLEPGGAPATFYVEYGTTTEYGRESASASVSGGSGTQTETAALTGLKPCTTYHYQAEAESEASEGSPSLGGDKTLTTAGCGAGAVGYAGGWEHSCTVLSNGTVECWGANEVGELGDGSSAGSDSPVLVSGITDATAVGAGAYYSCALLSTGEVDCWGENGGTEGVAISVGESFACAVISDGAVECWGAGGHGQLGNGEDSTSLTPVQVSGITNAVGVSAGDDFACAVLSSGTVDCWGAGRGGQLGSGTSASSTPVPIGGITNATEVTASDEYACARLAGGTIECWGEGYGGQLGNGSTAKSSTPEPVSGITNASTVTAAGIHHTCAVLASGGVDCWGIGSSGQLGNGGTENSTSPVAVTGLGSAAVATGGGIDFSCAMLGAGSIECWGENYNGTLGAGIAEVTLNPTPIGVLDIPPS